MTVSIRTKLIGLIFSIVLLVGGTISIYAIYHERKQSLSAYASENVEVVSLLSELLLDDLDFSDKIGLRQRLMDAQAYPRILYVYVMNPEGTVLADGSGGNYLAGMQPKDRFNLEILRATDWIRNKDQEVLNIGGPVYLPGKEPIGYLAVGFSLKPAYQEMRRSTMVSLAITAIGLGMGGILAILIATRMTRPISQMVEASKLIGEGRFDIRLPTERKDELGILAGSINQMAANLEATTISKSYVDDIFNFLFEPLIVLNPEGNIHLVNPAAADLLGYEELELLGKSMEVVLRDDAKNLLLSGELAAKGFVDNIETTYWTKDDASIPILFSASVMQDQNSQIEGIVCVARDITRRKQMENVLRESEERHRSLIEGVLDTSEVGIFILDRNFKLVWLNRAMQNYCGLHRIQVIGKDQRSLILGHLANIMENPDVFASRVLATYENNNYIENFECHVLPRENRMERWLEHWSQPIRSGLYAGGRIEHYYEITERKKAEQALQRSEQNVRRALEEREELGRDLHDGILQSLFAVNLGLEASKSLLNEDRHRAVQNLDQAIAQLKTVMREVREFITGTISSVSYKDNFETNVRSLVQSMTTAHPTRFRVEIDGDAAKRVSEGQAVQLLNVIREGISNTLRHAEAQRGEVAITRKGNRIRLELSDDGVGFNDDSAARRGHGLNNMKARAGQMGGQLEIFCKPGQGTRIILEVPNELTDNHR